MSFIPVDKIIGLDIFAIYSNKGILLHSPEPILKALNKLPKEKKAYMIGDTCFDCISAREANIKGIGVHSGYGTKRELKECCHFLFENSLKAVEFLEKRENYEI